MIIKLSNNETDIQVLFDYLKDVDRDFEIPLSSKVNLSEFARKTLSNGHAFMVREDDKYVALVTLYCNDKVNVKAFLPILSVKECYRGKGYARQLVNIAINISRLYEMKTVNVDSVNPIAISLYKSVGFQSVGVDDVNGLRKEYLQLTIPKIEKDDILKSLEDINHDFSPNLDNKVVLRDYATKIQEQASVMIETDRSGICGMVVFYCNNQETKLAYISLVGVSARARSQGIASRLVKSVCEYINTKEFSKIGIHSNNPSAIRIYQQLGFNIIEDEERKYMEMVL